MLRCEIHVRECNPSILRQTIFLDDYDIFSMATFLIRIDRIHKQCCELYMLMVVCCISVLTFSGIVGCSWIRLTLKRYAFRILDNDIGISAL
jgi:hypothetical protein